METTGNLISGKGTYDRDCIFCAILRYENPSQKVHSDEQTYAFKDISPRAPYHVLVIPRKHITPLTTADANDEPVLGRMVRVAAQIARAEGLDQSGYRLIINQGEDAGQEVDHLHLHILGGEKLNPIG